MSQKRKINGGEITGRKNGGGTFTDWWNPDSKCVFNYTIYTLIFIFICVIIMSILSNSSQGMYNVEKYFFVITVPMILLFFYILNINSDVNSRNLFIKLSIMMVVFGVLIYLYIYFKSSLFEVSYYANNTILICIALIGLSILYNFAKQYLERLTGWPGLIVGIIFYIPCLFWDAWTYLMNELKMTPYSVYTLLILEAAIIASYFYMPRIMDNVLKIDDGMVLLEKTYHLEKGSLIVANSDKLKLNNVSQTLASGSVKQYASNYAFSMWLFLNPQNASNSGNNKEVEVFSYGYKDKNGVQHVKPMIRYYGGGDGKDQTIERDKLIFYFAIYM